MAFTSINDADIDADSPLTTTLMTALRDNDNHLRDQFDPTNGHKHNGTDSPMIPNIFGTWSTGKTLGIVYQAAKDLIVVASASITSGASPATLTGYTDSSNPPVTQRAKAGGDGGVDIYCITFPVKKNDYWKVTGSNVTLISVVDLSIG